LTAEIADPAAFGDDLDGYVPDLQRGGEPKDRTDATS
jgi:hypothetical protein